MKPLSERDENIDDGNLWLRSLKLVGMKPLSERDENPSRTIVDKHLTYYVGMKPLSERDENPAGNGLRCGNSHPCRNEATLWKRWERGPGKIRRLDPCY